MGIATVSCSCVCAGAFEVRFTSESSLIPSPKLVHSRHAHSRAVTIPIRAFIPGVTSIEDIRAEAIGSARESSRTGFAKLIANVAAAEAIDAVIAQAFRALSTRDAIEAFAYASTVTSIRIVARHWPGGINRIIGNESASTNVP